MGGPTQTDGFKMINYIYDVIVVRVEGSVDCAGVVAAADDT